MEFIDLQQFLKKSKQHDYSLLHWNPREIFTETICYYPYQYYTIYALNLEELTRKIQDISPTSTLVFYQAFGRLINDPNHTSEFLYSVFSLQEVEFQQFEDKFKSLIKTYVFL